VLGTPYLVLTRATLRASVTISSLELWPSTEFGSENFDLGADVACSNRMTPPARMALRFNLDAGFG
jgi:hypothetical protein